MQEFKNIINEEFKKEYSFTIIIDVDKSVLNKDINVLYDHIYFCKTFNDIEKIILNEFYHCYHVHHENIQKIRDIFEDCKKALNSHDKVGFYRITCGKIRFEIRNTKFIEYFFNNIDIGNNPLVIGNLQSLFEYNLSIYKFNKIEEGIFMHIRVRILINIDCKYLNQIPFIIEFYLNNSNFFYDMDIKNITNHEHKNKIKLKNLAIKYIDQQIKISKKIILNYTSNFDIDIGLQKIVKLDNYGFYLDNINMINNDSNNIFVKVFFINNPFYHTCIYELYNPIEQSLYFNKIDNNECKNKKKEIQNKILSGMKEKSIYHMKLLKFLKKIYNNHYSKINNYLFY